MSMEKYDQIVESFSNGQFSQGKEQFFKLRKVDRTEFLTMLLSHVDGRDERWGRLLSYEVLYKLIQQIY